MNINFGSLNIDLSKKSSRDLFAYSNQFYYGHREILFDYADIDVERFYIQGIVQHGVGPSSLLVEEVHTPRKSLWRRSPYYCFSDSIRKDLVKFKSDVRAIGAPWIYLQEGKSEAAQVQQSRSSKLDSGSTVLFFPQKYTHLIPTSYDYDYLLRKMQRYRSMHARDNLVVCLFWGDYLSQEWIRVAKKLDFKIVTAGISQTIPHWSLVKERTNFLYRLKSLIKTADLCLFEGFTSAIFYSIDVGVPIYMPFTEEYQSFKTKWLPLELSWLQKYVKEIFVRPQVAEKYQPLIQDLLGYENLRSPEELRGLLELGESELKTLRIEFKKVVNQE